MNYHQTSRRLFSFGCSLTRYRWPTWADIIGTGFDYHENWGLRGAGNNYIANSVMECNLTRNLHSQDTVIIEWSSPTREDRYVTGKWLVVGNIFYPGQNIYDKEFVKSMIDVRGCYVRDLCLMHLTKILLDKIGCRYVFTSMCDLRNTSNIEDNKFEQDPEIDDLILHYDEVLASIKPSMERVLFNNDWSSRPWYNTAHRDFQREKTRYNACAGPDWPNFVDLLEDNTPQVSPSVLTEIFDPTLWDWKTALRKIKRYDPHPTPSEHLEYIDKILDDFTITDQVRSQVQYFDQKVRQFQDIEGWESIFGTTYPERW